MSNKKAATEVQGTDVANENVSMSVATTENEKTMQVQTSAVLNEAALAMVFESEAFEGAGTNVLSEYFRQEDWTLIQGKEVKCIFTGMIVDQLDEETGDVSEAVLFYSNYKDGKTPVMYKCAASNIVRGFKDGGKGLYKVIYNGQKARNGKKGTYMDFSIKICSKIV